MISAIVKLPMESVFGGTDEDSTYVLSLIKGMVSLVPGVLGNALYIEDSVAYSLGTKQETCFFDPTKCSAGSTLSLWVYYAREEVKSIYIALGPYSPT